jgi:O-antigen/teichoic acid export membrane protein
VLVKKHMVCHEQSFKGGSMNQLRSLWHAAHRRPLVKNAVCLLAGQGVGLVLQAIYFILLARLLGTLEYGIFIGAFAFTNIIAQYSSLGTGMVLMRYVSGNSEAFPRFWGNVLCVTLCSGTLLAIALRFTASRLLNPSSATLVGVVAIANCVCAQMVAEAGRICRAFERMRITACLNLLTSLLRAGAVVIMLVCLHKANAWQWAVMSTLACVVGSVVAVVVVIRQFGWPRFDPGALREHALEGLGYSFAQSTTSLYNDVDKTMLSSYGLNFATGIYTVAYRLIDIATIPITSLHDAALPKMFQLGREGIGKAKALGLRLVAKLIPVSVFIAVVLFMTAPLIPRFLGQEFAESVLALRWLCLIPLFRSIHNITGAALTGAGLQRYRTAAQVMAAAFNFAVNLYLIPRFGWLGAAWSSLVTDGGLGIMNWVVLLVLERRHREFPARCEGVAA